MLFPPIWLLILLTVLSAAALTGVFLNGWDSSSVAYIVYVLAFYTLIAATLFCVMVLPVRYRQLRQRILANPLGNRYMTDKIFRTKISLHLSLAVNLLYAAVNAGSFFLYRSWWFACLAVYYGILSVMRFFLVRYVRVKAIGADRPGELKSAIASSAVLLLLNFFLTGAVLMMVYQGKGYDYGGIMIYVMAMYTFYVTTHAIADLVKYKKLNSPVMSAAKAISLAAALVSMLNLETAMFAQFGADMAPENQRLMIILTGAGVSIAVVAMAVTMITRYTKELRQSN